MPSKPLNQIIKEIYAASRETTNCYVNLKVITAEPTDEGVMVEVRDTENNPHQYAISQSEVFGPTEVVLPQGVR